MKILLLTQDFPPVLNSAARLFSELAEDLNKYGYNVSVLTRTPERYLASKEKKSAGIFYKEKKNGVNIYRIKALPVPRHIPLLRALDHLWTSFIFLFGAIFLRKFEVIIVYSPPLPLALTGYILSRLWKGRVIVNVQDIYPQTVIDLGLLKNRLFIKIAELLELFVYRRSDAITVHSEGNRDFIIKRGAEPKKVYVIENWIDLQQMSPGQKYNKWREIYGLNNAFIISFAGTMGFAQGLMEILEVARKIQDYSDIVFVFAGDGVLLPAIKSFLKEKAIKNVKILAHQSIDAYREMLQASDICLVTLDKRLGTPVVPGKLQSIMAVGRPVICMANPASDAKKIIEESKCGFFINPDNIEGIVKVILELYTNKNLAEEMGRNGRAYAEKFFDRKNCIQKYLKLIGGFEKRCV